METQGPDPRAADAATRERLARNLARHHRQVVAAEGRRAAAVSVVLMPGPGGGLVFPLTRRARRLSAHAGQYALPGGRIDPGESALEAALRELREELGVKAGPDTVLGILDDLPTRSGYLVTPFVLWLERAPRLVPSAGEIAAVHRIPLADLFAGQGRGGTRPESGADEGAPGVLSLYIPTLGHDLFAPTAAILEHFREVALLGRPHRITVFGEPAFARR